MRIKDIIAESESLSELFQPGKKNWSWRFRGSEEASAEFNINGLEYQFYAYTHPSTPGVWEIEFKVANAGRHSTKFGLTGTGNAAEVMSTVTDIMREFLQQHRIESLVFTAAEPSRQALYKRMITRLLPAWGIHTSDAGNGEKMFVVTSPDEIDEGWKDWVAGAAMGAAALGGAQAAPKHHAHAPVAHVQPAPQIQKITPEQSRAGQSPEELKAYVEAMAQKYLPANQVAQFVGQVAHETANFTSMIEQNPEKNLKHYAKAKNPLGNKGMEDAVKYIGRGFLQITGKYNYKHFGDKIRPGLGDELLKNPNLAMRKDVAMALAIMFWRERVAPKMEKGASHKEIATAINGRKPKGLDSRAQAVKVAAATIPTKRRS